MFLQVRDRRRRDREGEPQRHRAEPVRAIEEASRIDPLGRGDALALNPFAAREWQLWPGAKVELGAEGIGTLRNTVATAG